MNAVKAIDHWGMLIVINIVVQALAGLWILHNIRDDVHAICEQVEACEVEQP